MWQISVFEGLLLVSSVDGVQTYDVLRFLRSRTDYQPSVLAISGEQFSYCTVLDGKCLVSTKVNNNLLLFGREGSLEQIVWDKQYSANAKNSVNKIIVVGGLRKKTQPILSQSIQSGGEEMDVPKMNYSIVRLQNITKKIRLRNPKIYKIKGSKNKQFYKQIK